MSFRELHTAAVHVVHIERAADIDTHLLQSRFGIHPIDADSTLSPAVESTFSSYRSYGYLAVLWPSMDTTRELRFFIDRRSLIIIGDTATHLFRQQLEHLQTDEQSARWQMNGPEILIDLLHELITTEQPFPSRANAIRLDSLTVALRQCGTWLQTDYRTVVPRMILLAHTLDLMSEQVRTTAAMTATKDATIIVPQVVRGYAVAAAIMIVGVIVTLSLH